MARPSVALGLLVLVVAAGCVTGEPAGVGPAETSAVDEPFEPRDAPSRTGDTVDNPWRADPIEVVVENQAGMDRNIHPQVMKALLYWEGEADVSDTYDAEYRLVSESDSPEIKILVVQAIDSCGVHTQGVVLGCAPTIPANASANESVTIRVRAGHSPETTLAILKHELGHTLGFEHDDARPVMNESLAGRAPTDVIDAADRRYPWSERTLRVTAVSESGVSDSERERVERALAYYQRGADGTVPSPPTFEYVDDPADAHVVVDIRESVGECDTVGTDHSCVDWHGPSVDGDPQPEYVTGARIVVGDTEKVGWHVGYWLGRSLWVNGVPAPFTTRSQPPATSW